MLPAPNTHQLLAAVHTEGPLLFGGLFGFTVAWIVWIAVGTGAMFIGSAAVAFRLLTKQREDLRYWLYTCMYGAVYSALGALAYMA